MSRLPVIDKLALNLASSPGEFALLLGSGVSRAASIPTGWEVTLDVIRQIAGLQGAKCDQDKLPEWFKATFGAEPRYSDVLEAAGPTRQARQRLVRRYFERADDDAEGVKSPTNAHRAIAKLVRGGFIRVIVTTNFDRLMELSLEAEGITPVVLATEAQVLGATPIHRNACTLVKVHGDYLDEGILNIDEELGEYPAALDALLDRVFDEYGIVFSGWSADYDVALRAAIERRTSRRYACVWTHRGKPSDIAQRLIDQQGFAPFAIKDADAFFGELATKTAAAAELATVQPESMELLAASAKRALKSALPLIDYRDLVLTTTKELITHLQASDAFSADGHNTSPDEFTRRANALFDAAAPLRRLLALGVFYRDDDVAEVVSTSFRAVLDFISSNRAGLTTYLQVRKSITASILAAIGLASIAADSFKSLQRVLALRDPDLHGAVVHVGQTWFVGQWLEDKRLLVSHANHKTAASDFTLEKVGPDLAEIFATEEALAEAFDRFELLSALIHGVPSQPVEGGEALEPAGWLPWGRFTWRRESGHEKSIWERYRDRLESLGDNAPELQDGLFHGDLKTALATIDRCAERLTEMVHRGWF
jgi:hypothetical protein